VRDRLPAAIIAPLLVSEFLLFHPASQDAEIRLSVISQLENHASGWLP
jgi:hypothetical protein